MTQKEATEAENEGLRKHGWYVHIHEERDQHGNVNYHTHGLAEKYKNNTRDLQIALGIPVVAANYIFWEMADLLEEGRILEDGGKYYLRGMDMIVALALAREDDRWVLRIIIPDADGKFSDKPEYKAQWEGTR